MTTNITDKQTMFRMLQAGMFGNTTPQWFSWRAWLEDPANITRPDIQDTRLWGIRSAATSGGDKRTWLDVPTEEVPLLCQQWYPEGGEQISPMVDHMATLRAHVHRDYQGLQLWAVVARQGIKWREAFAKFGNHWSGSRAAATLRHYLNPGSMEDLELLLDRYDGHVIELTALDRCFGLVPHRNAVIWEVRNY